MYDPLASALSRLPYLPSPESVIEAAMRLAKPREGEVLADLGCGDGRVLVYAARKYGVYAVGFELNPFLVGLAKREAKLTGLYSTIEIVHSDFFLHDLSRFDVIFSYPSPTIAGKLGLKLASECKPGCRVVIHDHLPSNLKPTRVISIPSGGPHIHLVALYRF